MDGAGQDDGRLLSWKKEEGERRTSQGGIMEEQKVH
jgi:hypothetical protein